MEDDTRLTIHAGDIEIDMIGGQSEIEGRLTRIKEDGQWDLLLEQIKAAVAKSKISNNAVEGLSERGRIFRAMIENCNLDRKPDQVLASIHYLRSSEGVDDCPPRVIEKIFEDAGLERPGNLSLYLNRLRERGLLEIPAHKGDKNRYAILSYEGRAHLESRSHS